MRLALVTVVVDDYDEAITFFTGVLRFELVEDTPAVTEGGRPKRWVVVRPPSAETGLLLARADGAAQVGVVGRQAGGRVAFFLEVDDFAGTLDRLRAAGVAIIRAPRQEPYGSVAAFLDVAGNTWDLVSRTSAQPSPPVERS